MDESREKNDFGKMREEHGRGHRGGHDGMGKRDGHDGMGKRDGHGDTRMRGGHDGTGMLGEYGGMEKRGGHGSMGRQGGRGAGHMLEERLGNDDTAILVFVGSLNCIRHKPYMRVGEMMRAGRAALLCPSMSDFSSGRYLNQIAEAVVELSRERGTKHFVLTFGCQWVILSTDGDLLAERLKRDYDIDLVLWEDSHLEFGDHE